MDGAPLSDLSPAEAVDLMASGAVLLDVREDHEWASGHAPDAVHLPMSALADRAAEIPTDRAIVCVCHVGARSAAVASALARAGWEVFNLAGGMCAWADAGLPVVDDTGGPGTVV